MNIKELNDKELNDKSNLIKYLRSKNYDLKLIIKNINDSLDSIHLYNDFTNFCNENKDNLFCKNKLFPEYDDDILIENIRKYFNEKYKNNKDLNTINLKIMSVIRYLSNLSTIKDETHKEILRYINDICNKNEYKKTNICNKNNNRIINL